MGHLLRRNVLTYKAPPGNEGYDLICMGSGHSARGLRQLYQPNVTDEIAEASACPVLTARYDPASRPMNGSLAEGSTA